MLDFRPLNVGKALFSALLVAVFACAFGAAADPLWTDKSQDPPDQSKPMIFPMPRPPGRYFYFYTRTDKEAQAFSLEDPSKKLTLKPETLIRFWAQPNPGTTEDTSMPFETVPLSVTDPVQRGSISLVYLGSPLADDPNGEKYEEYRKAVAVYAELQKQNQPKPETRKDLEARMDLRQVMRDFHNGACAVNGKRAKTKAEFLSRWKTFIDEMQTERGKQLARNARALDLTARTVLFESQVRKQLPDDAHPKAIACQWDLIALSIHSRAFRRAEVYRKAYGAEFEGDMGGVASSPQFNVWRADFVKYNPSILACYLFKNYDGEKGDEYRAVLDLIPRTLGIEGAGDQKPVNTDATDRFQILSGQTSTVRTYTHYYHPKGMGRCDVGRALAPQLVSGFLRIGKRGLNSDESTSLNYKFLSVPVINGRVLGHENLFIEKSEERRRIYYGYYSLPVYEWKIRVYQKKTIDGRERWVSVPAEDVFDAEVSLVDSRDLTEKFEDDIYTCLPQGIHPQCQEGGGKTEDEISASGRQVPLTWIDKNLRVEMQDAFTRLGFSNARQGMELPEDYPYQNPTGKPLEIRCISPGMEDLSRSEDKRFPSFGGNCDTNMMLFFGVDK